MKHIPELDGLRAIAILGVLFFHLPIPCFGLGWAGVQLFFLLSGFLITGILINSKTRDGYFTRFYIRRTLRIFPIYYLCFALVLVYAAWRGVSYTGWTYYAFYLQNYRIGFTSNHPEFPNMFSHSWSLAVEEQFYLLWPLAVWLLSARHLAIFCSGLIAGGFIFRAFVGAYTQNHFLADASLPGCMDALAAGGLLATLRDARPEMPLIQKARPIMLVGVLGLLLLGITGAITDWNFSEAVTWLSGWPAVMRQTMMLGILLVSICLIALCVNTETTPTVARIRRCLGWKPMVHIGQISYGLYVYHTIINYFIENGALRLGLGGSGIHFISICAAKLVLVYLVAFASYRYFEKPILEMKSRFE